MDIKDFIIHFSEQFEQTDPSIFTPDTVFWDIDEWSSIVALSVVAMVDEEYGVTLNSKDVKGVKTISELFNIVKQKSDDN